MTVDERWPQVPWSDNGDGTVHIVPMAHLLFCFWLKDMGRSGTRIAWCN